MRFRRISEPTVVFHVTLVCHMNFHEFPWNFPSLPNEKNFLCNKSLKQTNSIFSSNKKNGFRWNTVSPASKIGAWNTAYVQMRLLFVSRLKLMGRFRSFTVFDSCRSRPLFFSFYISLYMMCTSIYIAYIYTYSVYIAYI